MSFSSTVDVRHFYKPTDDQNRLEEQNKLAAAAAITTAARKEEDFPNTLSVIPMSSTSAPVPRTPLAP